MSTRYRPFRAYFDRAGSDGTLTFTASTAGIKRDGLDLVMEGAEVENYLQNPVVLWAHDYTGNRLPIGKVTRLGKQKSKMTARIQFDEADPFAREVQRKYEAGFLNAVSIGWRDLEWSDDRKQITRWELLDVSAVPVPGDPDALIEREMAALRSLIAQRDPATDGVITSDDDEPPVLRALSDDPDPDESSSSTHSTAANAWVRYDGPEPHYVDIEEGITWVFRDGTWQQITDDEHRGAITPHTTDKADEDSGWDGPGEVAKADADEQTLRRMHAWVDDDADPDTKRAYKLPHHQADGTVVWRGVAAAMARLLQAGTDIPEADRRGVYRHLVRHYRQFGKEPPEFRSLDLPAALMAGALPNDEWRHYRNELAEAVLEAAESLKAAITALQEAATAPEPEPAPEPDTELEQLLAAITPQGDDTQ